MDILESLEARWFFSDEATAKRAAAAWLPTAETEGKRVDHYLVTGRDDLGFKARPIEKKPARIETKYLLGALDAVGLAQGVVGRVERWRKLSSEMNDPQLRRDGVWLAVEKERRLRKLAYAHGAIAAVKADERPAAGCGVELTTLRFQRHGAQVLEWTFCLDAFGPEQVLLEVLQAACRLVFATTSGPELRAEQSRGYAAWLRTRES